jgi:hypothetical protein
MTNPTPLTPYFAGLTLEDVDIARAHHDAPSEVQAIVRHVVTARVLTPAQADLLLRYSALSTERQALVDDLIRHLGHSPAGPVPGDMPTPP